MLVHARTFWLLVHAEGLDADAETPLHHSGDLEGLLGEDSGILLGV